MARGVDLFGDRKHAKYSPKNLGQWESFLFARRKPKDERLEWFFSLVNCYKGRSGFLKVEDQCHSLDELVIRWLKVGDIVPTQCTRLAPVTSMYHTLSYILTQPNDQEITTPRVPCWQFLRFGAGSRKGSGGMELPPPGWVLPSHSMDLTVGFTSHFSPSCFDESILKAAEDSFPSWIRDMAVGKITLGKEELRRRLEDEPNLDHFPVSVKGTNYSSGVSPITSLTHGSPRRLNLFDSLHSCRYSRKHRCQLEDGYSYTLSVTYSPFYGGRNTDMFPGIAHLKLHVWKVLWHHLTPISKLCPPNGAQILYYFRNFQGKMNHHKDMNPDMVVDDATNSQILGSNVIVVSFYVGQLVSMSIKKNKKFHTVADFFTKHGSVYVLDPHDDFHFYHSTTFASRKRKKEFEANSGGYEGVRIAVTFRWLGNRMNYLGGNYENKLRRNCQAVANPRKVIESKHSARLEIANMFNQYV